MFTRLKQSLNFRMALMVFLVALLASIFWVTTFRIVFVKTTSQNQQEFITLMQEFVDNPEYQKASPLIPQSLQDDFIAIQDNTQQRINFSKTFMKWRWIFISTLFIGLIPITYFFAFFLARRVTTPLKTVATASQQLSEGDLTVRVNPNTGTWDGYSLALAKDFNHMAASLEAYEEERQTMIGDIAHELRTPVAIMQAQLESLQDGVDPINPEAIDSLYEETKLLSRLIIDLRTLSLAEAKQLSLQLDNIDLSDLVQKTVFRFQKEAEQKNIKLIAEAKEQHFIEADSERLNQVLSNLLSNALRHTPNGGWVKVKLEQQEADLVLSVADSGNGLSEEALKNVFDRFYRSDKGRVRSEGGSGLGLAIVKALTELHGGYVSVENAAQSGAVFTIYLPVHE